MGTRSLTRVIDKYQDTEDIIVCMYRQLDGYLKGHGKDLFDFLDGKIITNGLQKGNTANGVNCLAAQLVAHFKDGAGGIYLFPVYTTNVGQEYEYEIIVDENDTVTIRVISGEELFEGTLQEFKTYIEQEE